MRLFTRLRSGWSTTPQAKGLVLSIALQHSCQYAGSLFRRFGVAASAPARRQLVPYGLAAWPRHLSTKARGSSSRPRRLSDVLDLSDEAEHQDESGQSSSKQLSDPVVNRKCTEQPPSLTAEQQTQSAQTRSRQEQDIRVLNKLQTESSVLERQAASVPQTSNSVGPNSWVSEEQEEALRALLFEAPPQSPQDIRR